MCILYFFFNDTATTEIYTLSLHDALPIYREFGVVHKCHVADRVGARVGGVSVEPRTIRSDEMPLLLLSRSRTRAHTRSEEHTSELQSPCNLVCRLLLEKKKQMLARTELYP